MNFVEDTWFGEDGYFHSDAMHVTERFWRNGANLVYQVTVDDPKVLMSPWTMAPRVVKPSNELSRGIAALRRSRQQAARERRPSRTAMKTRLLLSVIAVMLATSVDAQRHQYRRMTDWGQLPPGKTWGEVTSVDIAPDGTVFVLSRCFAKDNNGCIGRENEPAILKFDKNGKLLKAWGEGMFVFPHGAFLIKTATTGRRIRAARTAKGTSCTSSAATASCS